MFADFGYIHCTKISYFHNLSFFARGKMFHKNSINVVLKQFSIKSTNSTQAQIMSGYTRAGKGPPKFFETPKSPNLIVTQQMGLL